MGHQLSRRGAMDTRGQGPGGMGEPLTHGKGAGRGRGGEQPPLPSPPLRHVWVSHLREGTELGGGGEEGSSVTDGNLATHFGRGALVLMMYRSTPSSGHSRVE